ncbi:MAG: Na(+)-translocating NADH-quinone reductase subunit A [Alloprevotella sp.]|nr:Na(+)-translocating NADH-quinone reductase subunit A [Alloprevotella sp.]
MENTYKLKKGLDLHLEGEARRELREVGKCGEYAVCPPDFPGYVPRLLVKEGDHVKAGDAVLTDKASERINLCAPVSGTIAKVERGDRRKLLSVRIRPDQVQQVREWGRLDVTKASATEVRSRLLEAGLFAFLRQRPYDVVPEADSTPRAIFVSAFSKMPLAADFSFVVSGQEQEFRAGIAALARIAKVCVGVTPSQRKEEFAQGLDAEVNIFDGPNPSGNVGVQINHVAPLGKGETVWTIGAEEVIFIGRLMTTGCLDLMRRVAVAGSCVGSPQYVAARVGSPLKDVLGEVSDGNVRVINGNPLVGVRSSYDGFLAAHATEVCVLPEGDDVHEAFGWILPRLKQHSTSRSYFSWLMPGKKFAPDCRIKGGQRHMIMSGEYDRVFPMDIFAGYLVKAIITGDIDRQEALGIYEVAPEDFAVAEYVDSSKLELQRIVREGLDILRKENA